MKRITSLRGPGLQLHLSRPSSPDSACYRKSRRADLRPRRALAKLRATPKQTILVRVANSGRRRQRDKHDQVAAAAGPDSSAGGVGEKKNEGFLETYFPSTSNAVESVCKSILIEAKDFAIWASEHKTPLKYCFYFFLLLSSIFQLQLLKGILGWTIGMLWKIVYELTKAWFYPLPPLPTRRGGGARGTSPV